VAETTELAGFPCTPHSSGASLLQVFTLHLAAAMPACRQWQEWSIENSNAPEPFYKPALKVVDGKVAVPTRPGWGVTVSPDYLSATEHHQHLVRRPSFFASAQNRCVQRSDSTST